MLRAVFLFGLVFMAASPASAQTVGRGDAATIAAAVEYLAAYQELDVRQLEPRYAEDATFTDPTSIHVPSIGGPFVWRGRSAILSGIESWKRAGVTSLQYDVEDVYEASGCVVFIGAVRTFMSTPDGALQFRYRIVTIVTIEDGRVVEHRDYTDYAGAARVTDAAAAP